MERFFRRLFRFGIRWRRWLPWAALLADLQDANAAAAFWKRRCRELQGTLTQERHRVWDLWAANCVLQEELKALHAAVKQREESERPWTRRH